MSEIISLKLGWFWQGRQIPASRISCLLSPHYGSRPRKVCRHAKSIRPPAALNLELKALGIPRIFSFAQHWRRCCGIHIGLRIRPWRGSADADGSQARRSARHQTLTVLRNSARLLKLLLKLAGNFGVGSDLGGPFRAASSGVIINSLPGHDFKLLLHVQKKRETRTEQEGFTLEFICGRGEEKVPLHKGPWPRPQRAQTWLWRSHQKPLFDVSWETCDIIRIGAGQ